MSAQFTWSTAKADANRRKHKVSFEEALTVFGDTLARIHDDPAHSETERREIIVGHSTAGRLLLVSFTERDHVVRIISARKATRGEHEDYEKPNGSKRRVRPREDLAREYRFDYEKSRANRFATKIASDAVVVVLDSDVAAVFRDPKRVNALLRATIAAVEKPRRRKAG